mgnify:CR=1 FL=1
MTLRNTLYNKNFIKSRIWILLIFLAFPTGLYAQFCFEVLTLDEHIDYEKSIKSEFVQESIFDPYSDILFEDLIYTDQFPIVNRNAHIFLRHNDKFFPTMGVWFFHDKNDSVKFIMYNWSFYNPGFNVEENNNILRKQARRFGEYKKKFDQTYSDLEATFGPAEPKSFTNSESYYFESAYWDTPDYRIGISMRFDKKVSSTPIIFGDWYIKVSILFKEHP